MNSHEDFHKAVDLERQTLTRLADYWNNKLKGESSITRDIEGRIRAAVGKTQLLLAEKFKQFEGLLEESEKKTSEKEISFNDLQGFWELVLIQVKEVKDMFQSFGSSNDKINSDMSESNKNGDQSVQKSGIKGIRKVTSSKTKSRDSIKETEKKLQGITNSH